MGNPDVRRSPFAGTWYPGDPSELDATVSRLLASAAGSESPKPLEKLVALVSPHAGLKYSGPIAAAGYRLLERQSFGSVVLLGPSHRVAFDGLATYPEGAFATPLGLAAIDTELARSFEGATPRARPMPEVHRGEHCLEMQLPFLQHLLPEARILPVVMGTQSARNVEAAASAMVRAVSAAEYPVLLVASSDLSHYESRDRARALDSEVLDRIERFDPEGLERPARGRARARVRRRADGLRDEGGARARRQTRAHPRLWRLRRRERGDGRRRRISLCRTCTGRHERGRGRANAPRRREACAPRPLWTRAAGGRRDGARVDSPAGRSLRDARARRRAPRVHRVLSSRTRISSR